LPPSTTPPSAATAYEATASETRHHRHRTRTPVSSASGRDWPAHIRVDQTHVTPALVPAIQDYRLVDPHGNPDHWGTVCTLDLALTDLTKAHVHP